MYDVTIIGGGAAGLYLASRLTAKKVVLAESEPRVGKKLLATGNGRCNLSFARPLEEGDYNTPAVRAFFESVPNEDTLRHFRALGLHIRREEDRLYPYSNTAASVSDCLRNGARRAGAETLTGARVVAVRKSGGIFETEAVCGDSRRVLRSHNVVLATGSDAGGGCDSLALYTSFGHTRRAFTPSLVPLLTDRESVKGLSGVRVKCVLSACGKRFKGEVLFRDNGLSGIAAMDLSSLYARGLLPKGGSLSIDFLPELTESEAVEVFEQSRLTVGETLGGWFHSRVAERIAARAGQELSAAPDYAALARTAKNYTLVFEGVRGKDSAQVMSGGLTLSEFDANLMSRICEGAYAVGEALDVDGVCGGFNLQWAWTSAEVAARAIERGV